MNKTEQAAGQTRRIAFLDNLRTFMIFLVVLLHAGIVYDGGGGGEYFWIVFDLSTNNISGILSFIIDIMVMPALFLLSGYFAPLSLENRGEWTFLKSRFKRLIIPWVIAVFSLIPVYKMIFLYSRNLPQENWSTYFHFSNGIFSQSWLWFLPVLFLFDVLYLLFLKIPINMPNITVKNAVWLVFILSLLYSFCMDIFEGIGWTKTIVIDFQNERLPVYFMIFLVGSLCFKQKAFKLKRKNKRLFILVSLTAWFPVCVYISLLRFSMQNLWKYKFSEIADALLLQFTLLLSMLCLLYLAVNTFRFFLNKPRAILNEMNKNSYGVYIVHTIVLGGIALSMLDLRIPSFLKHVILALSTYAASNLLVSFYRKVLKPKIYLKIMGEKL